MKKKRTREEIIKQKHIFSWRIDEFEMFYNSIEEQFERTGNLELWREFGEVIGAMIEAEHLEYEEESTKKIIKDFNKYQKRNFETLRRNSKTAFEKYINGIYNWSKDDDDEEEGKTEENSNAEKQREADKINEAAVKKAFFQKCKIKPEFSIYEMRTILKAYKIPLKCETPSELEYIQTRVINIKENEELTIKDALELFSESEEAVVNNMLEQPF